MANEPRSSDATGRLTGGWLEEMSGFVKSIDANHLLGTGEEGFDIGGGGYQGLASGGQQWLFNGSAGVGFSRNTAISAIDFGSIHLYPEAWGLPNSAGNAWIRDHIAVAGAWGKPLIIGEFGVRFEKAQTYDSWLSTIVLDGAAGGLVWQLLDGTRQDAEEYGIHCPGSDPVCPILRLYAGQFETKSRSGTLPPPSFLQLQQNYPNPFNTQTTISFTLPYDAWVVLDLFNTLGERVYRVVDGVRLAGTRKELLDAGSLAGGAYFYSLSVRGVSLEVGAGFSQTKKLLIVDSIT